MMHECIDKLNGTDKDYYLLVIDQNGAIEFANSYLITNLELDPKKIYESSFFNLIEPRYQKSFKDSLYNVQQSGLPVSIEVSAKNGSLHWIKWEISKHKTDAGSADKYFCMGYDIVGKHTVNKMQRVARRNYEAIMEGLTIGVIMQDSTGEILAANRKVAEIFETSLENIYKTNWLGNLWPAIGNEKETFSAESNPPAYAFKTGTVQNNIRATFTTCAGELKTILINSQPLYEKDQIKPVSVVSSFMDISREKELEQELTNEKNQHQKNITETIFAVQEKERTRIGHELHDNVNQLLGTSKMFVDLIKTATPEDAELKTKVTGYILTAIEEIRRLSREMVTPQLKEDGLITSITTLVEDLQAAHIMNVLFHHQDDVELLSSGKKVTLFRIVQEQVKNTIKYSKAKNLVIDLRMNAEDVQLIIEDDGVGFDPNQTRRGIGLSNIYERTRFYNGIVKIKTEPGKGCRMMVRIPLTS